MRTELLLVVPLLITSACGPAVEAAPPPATPVPVAPAPGAAPAPAPAPPPTAEELKKAADQRKLAQEFTEAEQSHQAELARLTPAVREATKSAVDKAYASTRAALTAALAGPWRAPKSAARDTQRHPVATLEFLGLKQNHAVLEIGPGEGWYTELLAPILAKSGKLYVTSGDANGPRDERSTLYALRTKLFLEKLPEAYGKVETVVLDSKRPKLPFESKLNLVLLFRGAHGMVNDGTLGAWLAEIHHALAPNGVLGIEQHRAAPVAIAEASSKKGYLPEPWLVEQVQAAGFKLVAKSEVNANPKDSKDYPEGVWSLPPSLREGDTNRDKYLAIGESDRMTLKFVKVALAKPAPAKPAPAKPAAAPAAAAPAAPAPAAPAAAPPAAAPAAPPPPAPAAK
jgi:predicted methyltransferase